MGPALTTQMHNVVYFDIQLVLRNMRKVPYFVFVFFVYIFFIQDKHIRNAATGQCQTIMGMDGWLHPKQKNVIIYALTYGAVMLNRRWI